MKLISMQDFVLEQYSFDEQLYRNTLRNIVSYANFLKEPLKLEMFINLNDNDEVLFKGFYVKMYNEPQDGILGVIKDDNFQFKGIWYEGEEGFRLNNICAKQRIEDLRICNELTDLAIKRIFS